MAIRGSVLQALTCSSGGVLTIALPAGTLANDLAIIYFNTTRYSPGYTSSVAAPAGWTTLNLYNPFGAQSQSVTASRILTTGDITAGTVSVTAGGTGFPFDYAFGIVTFVGALTVRECDSTPPSGSDSLTPLTVTTSGSVISTDGAVYFAYSPGTGGTPNTACLSRGALLQQATSPSSDIGAAIFAEGCVAGPYSVGFSFSENNIAAALGVVVIVESAGLTPVSPSIACGSPPGGSVGVPYSHTFPTTNLSCTVGFSITSGSLPPGLTLSGSGGIASGTPTTQGTYSFTVTAAYGTPPSSLPFSVDVACSITVMGAVSCNNPPAGTVGNPYSHTFPSSGVAPSTFSITSGSLPTGLTLNTSTGVVSGTPTAVGYFSFTIQAIDAASTVSSVACAISIVSTVIGAPNTGNTLVYFEQENRWMYHRNNVGINRFYGFLFDGIQMLGLTGSTPSGGTEDACAFNVDDFRGFLTQDEPLTGATGLDIECVYQSHYEDVGLPDNQKMWLEIVVDVILGAGTVAGVFVAYDNGATSPLTFRGSIVGTGVRQKASFPLGTNGELGTNISVAIDLITASSSGLQEIHNIYLYYYVEARLAMSAATIPIDLGSAQVKQCKELMLDIDTSYNGGGGVVVNIASDLPGNALTVRQSPIVAAMAGRAIVKFPFSVTEGFLWRLALTAESVPFRLYSARLLMRPVGVYVEAYESSAGFVWDSMECSFESLLTRMPRAYAIALAATPIKRYREIRLEIETFGGSVTINFLTDLPGNAQVSRWSSTVNTLGVGRRFVGLPLPAGINAPIEGRICRLQTSGSSKYILYEASVELLVVGEYIEAYEAAAGAVWDSREMDFGSAKPKECREIELDIETTGAVIATLYWDLPSYTMTQSIAWTTVSTSGRQKIPLPTTSDAAPFDYPVGRMFRLIITGTNAFRLYSAKAKVRELGCYLTGDEVAATPAGVWDSTPLDLGTERLKEYKKLEFEVQTDTAGTAALNLWTDQPAGSLTLQYTTSITTAGARKSVKIPLTSGIRGRLVQALVSASGTRLFNGRIWWRALNEPKAQWQWSPLPIPPTAPEWTWASFMVSPTPPGTAATDPAQWMWGKFMEVTATPNEYTWIDVPVEVTGP